MEIMEKFKVVLYPGEDGYFVVYCPAIPGCISQGKTREEALANIKEAIELCLEDAENPALERHQIEIFEVAVAP